MDCTLISSKVIEKYENQTNIRNPKSESFSKQFSFQNISYEKTAEILNSHNSNATENSDIIQIQL